VVVEIDGIGHPDQRVVDKTARDTAIRTVVFARAVGIK
jgi:hypothetical protein